MCDDREFNDTHEAEEEEVSETEAQAEDDPLSAEDVGSAYDDVGTATDSSPDSENDDPNDVDYNPNDDAPTTMEGEGFLACMNFVDDDGVIDLFTGVDL